MSKILAIQNLKIQFGSLISFIKLSSNEGKFDINKDCERIIAKTLSINKRVPYIVLEKQKKNFPAIDVSSTDYKVGFQITSEITSNKIKDTFLKVFQHEIDDTFSSIGIIFLCDIFNSTVTDKAVAKYLKANLTEEKFKKYELSKYSFSISSTISDISTLIQLISEENTTEEINQISDIIQEELGSIGLFVNNITLQSIKNDKSVYIIPNKIVTKGEQIEALIINSLNGSEKSKDYKETTDLIDTFLHSYSSILSKKKVSELYLKEAVLFQKTGDLFKADKALCLFEKIDSDFENNLDYILCKGKIVSQKYKDPKILEEFVKKIETKQLFKSLSNRPSLASFYWRLNILFSCIDNKKSENYFSKHKEVLEVGSYQLANNIQCAAISNIKLLKSDSKINNQLLETIPELLFESYEKYVGLDNFPYLDKCLASNLLLLATFDKMSKQPLNYYRKIFFIRKIFNRMQIRHNDEAMAEILFIMRKLFPEMYSLVFSKSISSIINSGKNNSFVKEIYFEVELEFQRICRIDLNSYVANIYKMLVL